MALFAKINGYISNLNIQSIPIERKSTLQLLADFIIEKKVGNKPSVFHNVIDEDGHEYQVNSRHHQHCATVSKPLRPVAWSEDGIIEAAKAKRILLIQWHPERKEIWGTIASDWPMFWMTSFFEEM